MTTVPLAYKFVCIAVMLSEINYCSSKLQLKERVPVVEQDIRSQAVFDPQIIGFAGYMTTDNYSFRFSGSGRLQFISKLEDGFQSMGVYRGNQSMLQLAERMSQMKSIISSNDAILIASNCLMSVEVDVVRLQQEKPATVEQQYFQSERGVLPIPLFYVRWGKQPTPTVDIMISGVDGGLLNLRQEDVSYSKRPDSLIKDVNKLLAISDEEFLKYSSLERSNLVVHFAAIHYPVLLAPSSPATNAVPSAPPNHRAAAQ